jgi:hypothetical protein
MSSKFVFIVPTFNASATITQMLLSLVAQSYPHWRVVIRDDMSTDNTPDMIFNVMRVLGLSDRLSMVVNSEKKWETRNVVEMLGECEDSEIVCRLDGDDWLCDCDALAMIDAAYSRTGASALWTAHRWGFSNFNISGQLPKNANPYVHPWVSSHLKTFKRSLLSGVSDSNFRDETGTYFKRIGDQAIYLPVLHVAAGNWHFEPIVAYHYTIDMSPQTFQTTDAQFQRREAEYLRARGFVSR